MNDPKKELIDAINGAQNVLVTVSKNPTVDQLAAAIGTTLVLNKLGKHGTAVFSGATPSTIDFLKPEATLEHTTDSLRDFIISLDKSKADKLRYKVEDQHVKIFITPYRSTIGQPDLEFSQGDFNVDVVLALGVHEQGELDQAITAHGRILHDAKIISVNLDHAGELGGINIVEKASSLSEVMSHVAVSLKEGLFDSQTATAFLTGIVAETERFSNEKTLPETMTVSAKLMAAGANQQLVATQLEIKPSPVVVESQEASAAAPETSEPADSVKHDDGSLEIMHNAAQDKADEAPSPHEIAVDEHGNMSPHGADTQEKSPHKLPKIITKPTQRLEPPASVQQAIADEQSANDSELPELPSQPELPEVHSRGRMILEPPTTQGTLTANSTQEELEDSSDPLSNAPPKGLLLNHEQPQQQDEHEQPAPEIVKPVVAAPEPTASVDQTEGPSYDDNLKSSIDEALENAKDQPALDPIEALNANPINLNLAHDEPDTGSESVPEMPSMDADNDYLDVSKIDTSTGLASNDAPLDEVGPSQDTLTLPPVVDETKPPDTNAPTAPSPPPVPPPMMPPLPDNSGDNLTLPPVQQ